MLCTTVPDAHQNDLTRSYITKVESIDLSLGEFNP